MPEQIRETAVITEAAATDAATSGRMLVQFISPGWGSSGYYSREVLEAAATDRVIPAGTHMYADHPTETDVLERPERSIRDLMAITVEDARLGDDGALVGEVQVVPQWRDLVETVRDAIGVSIRGSATDIVEGEAEGRRGGLIEGLVAPVQSVDFVTRAGRGGRVLQLLESTRANQRAVARGVSEATVNDTREALSVALRDAHGGDSTWVWVRDFDDTTVWFEIEGEGDDNGIYAQAYTETDGAVALTGERTEVRVVTTYVPATRPDGNTTEESEEDTMPNHSIEEAERLLGEANGRVTTLESERDTAIRERDDARRQLAANQRVARATVLVAERAREAEVTFDSLQTRGLLADLPLTEAGDFDEAAFTTRVDEAAAELRTRQGAGQVSGFGGTGNGGGGQEVTESDIDNAVGSAFGRQPVKGA